MLRTFICLIALGVLLSPPLPAGDDVIVMEQDYNIVENGKDGPTAKDVRQKLYIHKDFICIDEFGGKDKPTESIMLDLKNRIIYNLDHAYKKKVTESFEDRRKRIDARAKKARDDRDKQEPGPQRDKLEKMFRALLDDERRFVISKDPVPPKTIAGVECKAIKVLGEDKAGYVPLEGYMHPEMELPHDNAEVLYLLNIIGKRMADFLREHRANFKQVPMELHLDLAYGGTLDTKTISVSRMDKATLDPKLRGALGSPFEVPGNYEEKQKRVIKKTDEKEKAD